MKISRRQFMKYCTASAAALGLSQMDLLKLEKAFAAQTATACFGTVPVVWLAGQACSGCVTSLLNRVVDLNDPIEEIGDAWGTYPEGVVRDTKDLLVGDLPLGTNGLPAPSDAHFNFGYICHEFNMTVMASCSDLAVQHLANVRNAGGFALLVEGSTPLHKTLAVNGKGCFVFDDPGYPGTPLVTVPDALNYHHAGPQVTMAKALQWLAPQAAFIVNIGTCSSFGGIPAASYPTPYRNGPGARSTAQALALMKQYLDPGLVIPPIVNVPGCPPNPDWMIYPVAYYLIHTAFPTVDGYGRPTATYPTTAQCTNCSKQDIGPVWEGGWISGCLRNYGCKGPGTNSDCPTRQFNNFDDGSRNNYCVGSVDAGPSDGRFPCHGCVQPDFPDGQTPVFGHSNLQDRP